MPTCSATNKKRHCSTRPTYPKMLELTWPQNDRGTAWIQHTVLLPQLEHDNGLSSCIREPSLPAATSCCFLRKVWDATKLAKSTRQHIKPSIQPCASYLSCSHAYFVIQAWKEMTNARPSNMAQNPKTERVPERRERNVKNWHVAKIATTPRDHTQSCQRHIQLVFLVESWVLP